jgi:hypothetical protein
VLDDIQMAPTGCKVEGTEPFLVPGIRIGTQIEQFYHLREPKRVALKTCCGLDLLNSVFNVDGRQANMGRLHTSAR